MILKDRFVNFDASGRRLLTFELNSRFFSSAHTEGTASGTVRRYLLDLTKGGYWIRISHCAFKACLKKQTRFHPPSNSDSTPSFETVHLLCVPFYGRDPENEQLCSGCGWSSFLGQKNSDSSKL